MQERSEEPTQARAVNWYLSQTLRPLLWVIVDDGSTDRTPEIITEAAQKYERINFLRKMEEAKTIKVSPRVYAELNAFTGLLSERLKRRVSIDDALEDLLSHARRRNKPSDFAGAWVMSDEEEEEIKESLKELWGTWKMD